MSTPDQLGLTIADKQSILRNYFNDSTGNYTIKASHAENFEQLRTGYLGDHYLLTIVVGGDDDGGEERSISVFVKKLPTRIPKLANCLVELGAFSKETGLFAGLLARLADFGRFCPEFLFQKEGELLVFRNVKLEGFRVLDGNRGLLGLSCLECVLRTVAKLHAASFALEDELGKSIVDAFPGVLDENVWPDVEDHPRNGELENIIGTLCEFVKLLEDDGPRKEYLLRRIPDCIRQVKELVKSSRNYRNAVSHSDLWNNNIMFRLDESGVPVDCLLVDFQMARFVPPAYDFDMLISLTTTREFRMKYLTNLQELYYQSLRSELARHDLDIEQILTQDDFWESCKFYRRAGAFDSFTINHATLLPRHFLDEAFSSVEQFDRFDQKYKTELCLKTFQEDEIYRSRIVDIVEELYEAFELN